MGCASSVQQRNHYKKHHLHPSQQQVHRDAELKQIQRQLTHQLQLTTSKITRKGHEIKQQQKDLEQLKILKANNYNNQDELNIKLDTLTQLKLQIQDLMKLYKFKTLQLADIKQFKSSSQYKEKYVDLDYKNINAKLDQIGKKKASDNYQADKIRHQVQVINRGSNFQRVRRKIQTDLQIKQYDDKNKNKNKTQNKQEMKVEDNDYGYQYPKNNVEPIGRDNDRENIIPKNSQKYGAGPGNDSNPNKNSANIQPYNNYYGNNTGNLPITNNYPYFHGQKGTSTVK